MHTLVFYDVYTFFTQNFEACLKVEAYTHLLMCTKKHIVYAQSKQQTQTFLTTCKKLQWPNLMSISGKESYSSSFCTDSLACRLFISRMDTPLAPSYCTLTDY